MKSYTDISQSKKLAEILPIESADGTWKRVAIAGINLDVPEEHQYFHDGDTPFIFYSGVGIPSWSLAALIDIINENYYTTIYHDGVAWNIDIIHHDNVKEKHSVYDNTPVDACYEMILKLHERKLL